MKIKIWYFFHLEGLHLWRFDSSFANLMIHAYESSQMEVRLFGNILSSSYLQYGCLVTKGMWFENLWKYLSEIGVSIELDDNRHFKPFRTGDNLLMDLF